ncbi:lipoprotein [Pseudorhodoferax sp. Leaf267]|uniref:LPS translocon maturation chaperone LptM n=1 Tax=Pseudorhodoferax sp. Leaf267 TaxID=1736316 RepID=UPI0012E17262|nr:lipoprotein [Pseudorhodoferax sp. Leaf267]
MSRVIRILVTASCVLALSACGQKGNLYYATDAAAANRASLGQTLTPGRASAAASAPAPVAQPLPPVAPVTPPLPLPGS